LRKTAQQRTNVVNLPGNTQVFLPVAGALCTATVHGTRASFLVFIGFLDGTGIAKYVLNETAGGKRCRFLKRAD
jgi:hypothetical protein